MDVSRHIETVCLLSKLRTEHYNIKVDPNLGKMDLIAAKSRDACDIHEFTADNKTSKNEPNFKNINAYAHALLHHTSCTDIIAIGMTGYKDDSGSLQYSIGVYYVPKNNFGVGQKMDDYSDSEFFSLTDTDSNASVVARITLSCPSSQRVSRRTIF